MIIITTGFKMGLCSMAAVPCSVACALQESSINQTSKNSGTGEGEAAKRFDF